MRYEYWQNDWKAAMEKPELRVPQVDGYKSGDTLVKVYEDEIDELDLTCREPFKKLASQLWDVHNADLRPRRKEIRSMCVGDVIVFRALTTIAIAVEPLGFYELPVLPPEVLRG